MPVAVNVVGGVIRVDDVIKSGPNAGRPIQRSKPTWAGVAQSWKKDGKFTRHAITVSLKHHMTAEAVWATMTHELGHIIDRVYYADAPHSVRVAVDAAFQAYIAKFSDGTTIGQMLRLRDNPISLMASGAVDMTKPVNSLTDKELEYHLGFAEWFAEQVAKWATSRVKPLSVVEKFFSGLWKEDPHVVRGREKEV